MDAHIPIRVNPLCKAGMVKDRKMIPQGYRQGDAKAAAYQDSEEIEKARGFGISCRRDASEGELDEWNKEYCYAKALQEACQHNCGEGSL